MARPVAFLTSFKDFISKGNVVDLAIAVIIAGAFKEVIKSVVTLIMTNALSQLLKRPMSIPLPNYPRVWFLWR